MSTQKTILVVEDEKDIREALRDALQDNNHSVLEAKDGREGVSMAIGSHPDLILLDLLMPEMDGMTALKHIREDVWGKNAPVIILTNVNASKEQIIEDMVTGKPLEYLIKSDWKIHDVIERIEKVLQTNDKRTKGRIGSSAKGGSASGGKNNSTTNDKEITVKESRALALHYMKTLVDVARESFLILDAELRVISVSPSFYDSFQVSPEQTESKFVFDLGDGQWNITELKKLLEEILPEKKVVKNYEVTHVFEKIGKRTMLLNAGQVDAVQLIVLAMEDITERKNLEEKLSVYTKGLEAEVAKRTEELAERVKELETLNKTMVGRELKMVELKKEIERMKKAAENTAGTEIDS